MTDTIDIKGCSACGFDHSGLQRVVYQQCQNVAGSWPTIDGSPVRWFAMCPRLGTVILIASTHPAMDSIKRLPYPRALEFAKAIVDVWVSALVGGRRGYTRWEPIHADGGIMEYRVIFCTASTTYSIRVRPDYLGAYANMRRTRAGEDWLRGSDLPDGPLSEQTWGAIKAAILRYDLVLLASEPDPMRTADFSSFITEADGKPIQPWAEKRLPTFNGKDDGKPRCTHETGAACDLLQAEGCRPNKDVASPDAAAAE